MLPMLERENLLYQLHSAADAARSGSGKVVVLEGEAGSGKTRLTTEFLANLDVEFVTATGYCERQSAEHPLSALYDIAGQLGGEFRATLPGSADPFTALIDAIRKSERCVVLVFEDAHWADAATRDLLRFLCRRVETLRALVIVTYRDDETGPDHPFTLALGDFPSNCASYLALARLSQDAVSELSDLHGKDAEAIFAQSAGNPFLATELLKQVDSSVEPAELPSSIRQAVAARLAPLDTTARAWTDLLSIFPDGLDRAGLRLLGKSARLDPAHLPEWSGLLAERADGSICYRHEATRLAVRAAMSSNRRRQIKADALAALAEDPEFVSQHIDLMGDLAERAGDCEAAISIARAGADRAIATNNYRTAVSQLERALPLAAALDARLHASLVLDWAELSLATEGLDDEAVAVLRRCADIWRQSGNDSDLARYRILMARVGRELGLFDPYPAETRDAREAARQHCDGSVRAHALVLIAHDRLDSGDLAGGREFALAAIREARSADDRFARLYGWLALAQARHRLGHACGARMAQVCALIAERDGMAMLSSAITACLFDETFAARDLATAEACLGKEPHHRAPPSWQGGMAGRLALLQVVQGRISEGEALADEVLRDNAIRPGMRYHAALAMALARMRRLGRGAGEWLAEAEKLIGAAPSCRDLTQVRTAAIELAFLSGDVAAARAYCAAAAQSCDGPVGDAIREEVNIWQARLELAASENAGPPDCDPPGLADTLRERGMPFEAALSTLMAPAEKTGTSFGEAICEFEAIGADGGVVLARKLARKYAIEVQMPRRKRGPYRAARQHPLRLTRREVEILRMIVEGEGNREIAGKLGRSLRTVEHHVSAILGKMGIDNRIQAVIQAISRPEILGSVDNDA